MVRHECPTSAKLFWAVYDQPSEIRWVAGKNLNYNQCQALL